MPPKSLYIAAKLLVQEPVMHIVTDIETLKIHFN